MDFLRVELRRIAASILLSVMPRPRIAPSECCSILGLFDALGAHQTEWSVGSVVPKNMETSLKFIRQLCALALVMAAMLPVASNAQAFPDRPVRIVLPYPPGGGPDNVMRIVGERLSKMWGQPVIVDNRPGGNGWIGINTVKLAPPDGYTLLMVDAALFCLQPHLYQNLPYDPFKDFVAIAPVFSTNYFMVVKADSPWKSVKDLLVAAKAEDGHMTYGSSGVGSQYHLGGAMLESMTGVKMTHVPYKDTMQIFTDIIGGRIDWSFATASTANALYQAKKLKFLAIAAPHRYPTYPDVPTVMESGGPNMELRTWVGIFAPAGTAKEAADRLSSDFQKVMAEPEIQQKLNTVGLTSWSGSATDLRSALTQDYNTYGAIQNKVKIKIQ
ncbi:tripartite tricarboxylate transporter substrate binding protein [Paraburkholderia sp. JHI869]|uniref:Bug family tripartite tricarboxylate transporter substrate binding protein n=1 Tax=Paraburkholderia sp. JHI869 TaxID=3112959 RepID=UPI003178C868